MSSSHHFVNIVIQNALMIIIKLCSRFCTEWAVKKCAKPFFYSLGKQRHHNTKMQKSLDLSKVICGKYFPKMINRHPVCCIADNLWWRWCDKWRCSGQAGMELPLSIEVHIVSTYLTLQRHCLATLQSEIIWWRQAALNSWSLGQQSHLASRLGTR